MKFCIKKLKEKMLISGGMSSTLQKTGYNCAAINVTVSPVSWFSLDVVLVSYIFWPVISHLIICFSQYNFMKMKLRSQ